MSDVRQAAVRVVVRVRPFIDIEEKECKNVVKVEDDAILKVCDVNRGGKQDDLKTWKTFGFDRVYSQTSTQEQVYFGSVKTVIDNFLEGFNATVFAYGQTSSGKTFTMTGNPDDQKMKGMTPRAVEQIFEEIRKDVEESNAKYVLTVSFLEIYNEKVRDLLSDNQEKTGLKVRQERTGGFFIPQLSKHLVTDASRVHELIRQGNERRSVAATKQNVISSRSHSILSIYLERASPSEDDLVSVISSKLNLVDLAGSERFQDQSSERQRESANINLSLNTLGNVVSALTTVRKDGKKQFVPYRESALTKLLHDSLGGNAHTLMIANVNPCDRNVSESLSTMQYATRAKKIQNKARKNLNPKDALIQKLREEIEILKVELRDRDSQIEQLKAEGKRGSAGSRRRYKKKNRGVGHKSLPANKKRGFFASLFSCCSAGVEDIELETIPAKNRIEKAETKVPQHINTATRETSKVEDVTDKQVSLNGGKGVKDVRAQLPERRKSIPAEECTERDSIDATSSMRTPIKAANNGKMSRLRNEIMSSKKKSNQDSSKKKIIRKSSTDQTEKKSTSRDGSQQRTAVKAGNGGGKQSVSERKSIQKSSIERSKKNSTSRDRSESRSRSQSHQSQQRTPVKAKNGGGDPKGSPIAIQKRRLSKPTPKKYNKTPPGLPKKPTKSRSTSRNSGRRHSEAVSSSVKPLPNANAKSGTSHRRFSAAA